jgi:hypothetical protein
MEDVPLRKQECIAVTFEISSPNYPRRPQMHTDVEVACATRHMQMRVEND